MRRGTLLILGVSIGFSQAFAQSGLANSSWPAFRHDEHLTARTTVNGPVIPETKWIARIGADQLVSPIVGPDGTVYVSGFVDDNLYAIDPANGQLKWTFRPAVIVPADPFVSPPVVDRNGILYLGSTTQDFYAVNPDGTQRWHVRLGGAVYYSANIGDDGTIYVVADDCRLYALTPDGTIAWRADIGGLPHYAPAVDWGGSIFVAAGDFLAAYRSDGSLRWRKNFPGTEEVNGVVAPNWHTLYIISKKPAQICAIRNSGGEFLWCYQLPPGSGNPSLPAIADDGTMYLFGSEDDRLLAFNPDGTERWRFTLPGTRFLTDPVVDDSGYVYLVNDDLGLISISRTGKLRWSLPNVRCNFSLAFGTDGDIYVPSFQKVYAVAPQPSRPKYLEKLSGDAQIGCMDSTLALPVRVLVKDQYHQVFRNRHPVRFHVLTGGGSPQDLTVDSDGNGIAATPWTLGPNLGLQMMAATALDTVIIFEATAIGPQISGATEFPFDSTAVKKSSNKTYFIHNNSECTLHIERAQILDTVHPSFYVTAEVRDRVINPGDSLGVPLQFAPLVSGDHTATLRIFSNDSTRPQFDVALSGFGVDQPDIVVVPDSLGFGKVAVKGSRTLPLTIYNLGTAELVIHSLVFSDSAFSTDTATPIWIDPTKSVIVNIRFSPTKEQDYSDTLTIENNDPDTPSFLVKLTGTGTPPPDIEVRPPSLVFGPVCLDSIVTDHLTIFNRGGNTLVIDSLKFSHPVFSTTPGTWRIAPGESKPIPISFAPTDTVVYNDSLLIFSNDPDENPFKVALRGEGTGALIALEANPPRFPDICIGESAVTEVFIANESEHCVLRVDSVEFAIVFLTTVQSQPPLGVLKQKVSEPFFINPREKRALPSFKVVKPPRDFVVQVTVWSNATNANPIELDIPGKVIPPVIAGVDSVNFGRVLINTITHDTARVWNAGKCLVIINDLQIIGVDAAAFALGSVSLPIKLDLGDTARIPITFSPTEVRRYTATLLVLNNDLLNDSLQVQLVGSGRNKEPNMVVEPGTLDFGTVCQDSQRFIIVSNVGDTTLQVDSLAFSNKAFSSPHPVPFFIEPGKHDTIRIRYIPVAGKEAQGTLSIYSNDPDESPAVVTLHGQGGVPDIAGLTQVEFDTVEVQTCAGIVNSDTTTYVIHNVGTCDLRIDTLRTSGDFAVISSQGQQTVPAGDSLKVELKFTPSDFGDRSSTLQIVSNDPDESPFPVTLHGYGLKAPDIEVKPLALDFGAVPISGNKSLPITIRNVGALDLSVDSLVISNPVFTTPTGNFILQCKEDSVVTVTFTPTSEDIFAGTLSLWSNDPQDSPVVVQLRGEGVHGEPKPCISITPDPLSFDSVYVGDTRRLPLTILNTGKNTLWVTGFTITKPPFDIDLTGLRLPINLPPDSSTVALVTFTPTEAMGYAGTLTITSNATCGDSVVALSGYGKLPYISEPDSLDFGPVCVGSDSLMQIRICNIGNRALSSASITTSRPEFSADPTLIELMSGTCDTITVAFKPKTIGVVEATLTIVWEAPPGLPSLVVPLKGEGLAPQIAAEPETLDFGRLSVDASKKKFVTVLNKGECILKITKLKTTGSDSFAFVPDTTRLPLTVAPGEHDSIGVTFTPRREGNHEATLLVYNNDLDPKRNPLKVYLQGEGAIVGPQPCISVTPEPLPFGGVCVDDSSKLPITIHNDCTDTLRISGFTITKPPFAVDLAAYQFPIKVPPQDSAVVWVTFAPTDFIPYTGTLVIHSNATFGDSTVTLSGSGLAPQIAGDKIVDFGKIEIFTTAKHNALVWNAGECLVRMDSLKITGPDAAAFFADSTGLRWKLEKGDTTPISVTFTPQQVRPYTATLLVYNNDSHKNPLAIALVGEGKCDAAHIKVYPTALHFGEEALGDTATMTLTVYNLGCQTLSVTEISNTLPAIFWVKEKTFDIAPHDSHKVIVFFAPEDPDFYSDSLHISSNDPDPKKATLFVKLDGSGKLPYTVEPDSVKFAAVCVGSDAFIEVKICNISRHDLVADTAKTGQPQFKVEPNNDIFIPAGRCTTLLISFTPDSVGTFLDTLTVVWRTNLKLPSSKVPLTGDGIAPQIAAEPPAVDFVFREIGDSQTKFVAIRNIGDCELKITALNIIGPDSLAFKHDQSALPPPIPSGQSHRIGITFTAKHEGDHQAVLRLTTNDLDNPQFDVPLRATMEIVICIQVMPETTVDFGPVRIFTKEDSVVRILNCGNVPFIVNDIKVDGQYFSCDTIKTPITIPAHKTVSVPVYFAPESVGRFRGEMLLIGDTGLNRHDSQSSTMKVDLSGRGQGRFGAFVQVKPNPITPNGDDRNDIAKFTFEDFEVFSPTLKIFDLRGLIIYSASGDDRTHKFEWNGQDERRHYVLPGVYLWIVQDGNRKFGSGYITVIR